jgi:hypothetical protein
MQRILIITTNCALLVLLLIGLPAATHDQVGNLQLSSATTSRMMLLTGLGIAAGLNVLAGLFLIKAPKQKIICWEWAGIFAAVLLVYYAYTRGYFNFEWLKKTLLWLQHHL